jgi:polysaccharide biosynthesis/export protein
MMACLFSTSPAQVEQSQKGFSFAVLRPGDVIRLTVWREPTINGEYVVDERGRVSLPHLGEIHAAGEKRDVIREKIRAGLAARIEDLSMQLTFVRRIPVVGAVRTPGLIPADATMTVGDLIGLAGGFNLPQAQTRIVWLRNGQVIDRNLGAARAIMELDIRPGDQFLVPERSWLSRNLGVIISPLASILVAVLIYR